MIAGFGRCLIVVLLSAAPLAAQSAALTDSIPFDPALEHGRLENGISYYLRTNSRPEHRAELRLVVKAGSVLEEADQLGYAHFVEHMAFNGTKRFAKQQLIDYLESIGMRFGADLNAYTSFDETVYTLQVPTDSLTYLETGLGILQEWAQAIAFEAAEVIDERGVVIEEWRSGRGASARIQDAQWPLILGESRYSERLPIGTVASLEKGDSAGLAEFYQRWYRPDLMAVVVVGDFDLSEVRELIRRIFGGIPAPAVATELPKFGVTFPSAPRIGITTDAEAQQTTIGVLTLLASQVLRSAADWESALQDQIVGYALNERLAAIAQRRDAPFLGAGGGRGALVAGVDVWSLSALVSDGGAARGLEAVLVEATRLKRHGITAGELTRAKAEITRNYERLFAERQQRQSAEYAGAYVGSFLSGQALPSIEWRYQTTLALLERIDRAEVNEAARTRLLEGAPVVLVEAPEAASGQPISEPRVNDILEQVRGAALAAEEDDAEQGPLVANGPNPGRVVSEQSDTLAGVIDWRLSNDVRVLLKITDFRDDQILFRGIRAGGLSLSDSPSRLADQLAAGVVVRSGLGNFDAIALDKFLAGKTAGAVPSIGLYDERVDGQASPRDLETMLQLVWMQFQPPRADSNAYQAFAELMQAFVANRVNSPEAAFQDTLQAVIFDHHPLTLPFTSSRLAELNHGRALEFYRERFADAAGYTFFFVGNFEPAVIRPLVERWLGSLPVKAAPPEWRDLGMKRATGLVERKVYQGIEPKSQTAIVLHGEMTYNREQRFLLDALKEILSLRLRERLREALGGTYGVSVGSSTARIPREEFTLSISFGAAPDRVDSLTAVVLEEVAKLRDSGPTSDEIDKISAMRLREWETAQRENSFWMNQLEAAARLEEITGEALRDQERLMRSLSAAAVSAAARNYLKMDNRIMVTLYPSETTPTP